MPEIHARLSASGAKRWMACPKSVAVEETLPESTSAYAEEGTKAHALAEKLLAIYKATGRKRFNEDELEDETSNEMLNNVYSYVDYIAEIYEGLMLEHKDTLLFVEVRVDFSRYVKEGFGTCDCAIIANKTLHVIDLKYGKGVRVDCKGNPQPRLYALGAIEMFDWEYPLEEVKTHIYQPRLDWLDTETNTVDFLRRWGEEEVKPKAELAWNDEGEFNPGEHCQFCKAKPICKARAKKALEALAKFAEEGGELDD